MKKKKLTLADAQKILESIADGMKHPNPEVVKEAMSMLMKAVMASHEQEGQVSRAIKETPELPCPWRQSDELQRARLSLPEPSHVDYPVIRYLTPPPAPVSFEEWTKPPDVMPAIETKEMRAKMFVSEGGARFKAWTADGKTPIFPIPL